MPLLAPFARSPLWGVAAPAGPQRDERSPAYPRGRLGDAGRVPLLHCHECAEVLPPSAIQAKVDGNQNFGLAKDLDQRLERAGARGWRLGVSDRGQEGFGRPGPRQAITLSSLAQGGGAGGAAEICHVLERCRGVEHSIPELDAIEPAARRVHQPVSAQSRRHKEWNLCWVYVPIHGRDPSHPVTGRSIDAPGPDRARPGSR